MKREDSTGTRFYQRLVQSHVLVSGRLQPPLLLRLKDRSDDNISGAAPKPYITILNETKDWSLLSCEVLGAFPKPDVRWQNRDGDIVPAEEPQVSERGGSYDIVLQTTVTKTDHYRCVSTQEEINHQTHAEIFVHLNGAAPEPNITTLGETKEGVQLQCSVRGASPKPEVYWLDGDKNIVPAEEPQVSERGGRYEIILQTTVTKTDIYRCVSKQNEIETHADKYVPVNGAAPEPHSNDQPVEHSLMSLWEEGGGTRENPLTQGEQPADHFTDAGGTVPGWIFAVVGFAVGGVIVGGVVYFVLKKKTHSAVPTNSV